MTEVKTSKNEIKGKINEILFGSGAIERCPKCRRPLVNNHCPVHLDVDPEKDLRVKAKLSSGKIIIINGKTVENLLEINIEDAHTLPEYDILRLIKGRLGGKTIRAEVKDIDKNKGIFYVKSVKEIGDF